MGGLGVILILGLYIFVMYQVVKFAKSTWLKAVVLIAALLIPSADAIYGRIKLKHMCEVEAGLKVNRVVGHVEGFMSNNRDYWIKEHGFQFAEDYPINGTVTRYSKQGEQIIREDHVPPKSHFRLTLRHLDEKETYSRSQYLIEEISTGEVLATQTQIGFNGGWAEKLITAFSDGGVNPTWCEYTDFLNPIEIVSSTFKH